MSEVNEKKARKAAAAAEKAKKEKAFKIKAIVITVAAILIVACALVINSNLLYTKTTAIEIGDTRYSPAEYNFYYNSAFSEIYSSIQDTYGDLASYFVDTTKPMDEQTYIFGDGTQTWDDYLREQTVLSLTNFTALYDAAVKAGYTVSDESKTEIENTIASYEAYAASNNRTLDGLLALNFGKGVDEELFRSIMEKQSIASDYATDLNNSFSYTDDEMEAYYVEHQDDYDFFTYHAYYVSSSNTVFSELEDDAKAEAAAKAAAEIAQAETPEEFTENVYNFVDESTKASYEETDSTKSISQGSSLSSDIKEWITDPARVEGDTTTIDGESGSYAIMYISRENNDYNTVNVRHILVKATADDDGSYSEEALFDAKTKAEELLKEWELDATEDNFAKMAEQYSEDTGSNTNGGLYEEVIKEYMVEEFNDFIFDPARMPGDTGIVYGNNGSYAGYHIIYFVGEGDNLRQSIAESQMRDEDYDAAVSALVDGYKIAEGAGIRFTGA